MFRKAFIVIFLLIAGCGAWMLVTRVAAPTSQHNSSSPQTRPYVIWTAKAAWQEIQQIAFEADGKTLICMSTKAEKWDVATGKLKSTLRKQGNSWQQYSADGKYYLYGVLKNSSGQIPFSKVNLHDAQSNTLLHTFNFPNKVDGNLVQVDYHAIFSNKSTQLNLNYTLTQKHPKSRQITSTDVFTVWDTQSGQQINSHIRILNKDTKPYYYEDTRRNYYQDPTFSPDNKQLWLLESDSQMITESFDFNAPLKAYLTDLLRNKKAAVFSITPVKDKSIYTKWVFLSASPHGSLIAAVNTPTGTMSDEGILFGFNVKTQKVLWRREANGLDTQVLAFSPDGKFLAWGGRDLERKSPSDYYSPGKLLLLDPQTGTIINEVTARTPSDSVKQKQIETMARLERWLSLKRRSTQLPKHFPGETPWVNSLAFSPDSKKLAVGYADGTIKLWKIQ